MSGAGNVVGRALPTAQDLEGLGRDLLVILEGEVADAREEVTAERKARLAFVMATLPQLAAQAAAGEDVSAKVMGCQSILLDDAAIAALVIRAAAERAIARGLELVGKWLASFARGLLFGAIGVPAR